MYSYVYQKGKMPPPQKNTGNKNAVRETGVSKKNKQFIQTLLDDVMNHASLEGIHIARVISKYGNGRMEIFFVNSEKQGVVTNALIRGSFRGKGKHSVWIDIGSIVVAAKTEFDSYEIVACIPPEDVRKLTKEMDIDPRVLAVDNTDQSALMKNDGGDGFEFADDDVDVDNI